MHEFLAEQEDPVWEGQANLQVRMCARARRTGLVKGIVCGCDRHCVRRAP